MKRFDPPSIKDRLIKRAEVHEDWATILSLGTIGTLFDSIAEGNAEIARYLEYLYLEKKWRTARNMSSLMHLADLIAYKRQLPKSSIGYVIVSHTDLNGINRLQNFGSVFFDLNQESDWDDLIEKQESTAIERAALVPWTANEPYRIPAGSIFKSNSGVSFISTEIVESRSLKEPWSSIKANKDKMEDFIFAGGWNGIKYVRVPVIQGEQSITSFGFSKGQRFESYTIPSLKVENASNSISTKYFSINVTPMANGLEGITERWEKIENIKLAGPYDKVFETKILNNEQKVLVKFGDGITGQIPPRGAKLEASYIETKGSEGNIEERYQITNLQFPEDDMIVDPRTNQQVKYLNCTNIVPISGGKDIQELENFRTDAPPSYLRSYSISTTASYLYQLLNNSPINLLHCKIFTTDTFDIESFGIKENKYASIIQGSMLTEVSLSKNIILISAIKMNGELIDDPENELIDPIIKQMGDRKSPADSFGYLPPNMVELRPNIVVYTTNTMPENDIVNYIMPQILSKYSIYNTAFERPYYKSDIIKMVQQQTFTNYTDIFIEAKRNVKVLPNLLSEFQGEDTKEALNPNNIGISGPDQDRWTLCDFEFQFDKLFSKDKISYGFKNYKYNTPYLLRIDMIFKDNPENSKSLFLYDQRQDISANVSLETAENMQISRLKGLPVKREIYFPSFGKITYYDEEDENFQNRQVRVAQFNFIEDVTNDSYCSRMKLFNSAPFEIRPLYVDDQGYNKQFLVSEVPKAEQISLNFTNTISGSFCYRKNTQYMHNTKILFTENYETPDSVLYAKGHLIIPLKYVIQGTVLQQIYDANPNETDKEKFEGDLQKVLQENLTINAYAIPILDKFECINPFDIIYSNQDNILIKKSFIMGNKN